MSRGFGRFSIARNLAKRLSFSVIPEAPTIERPLPPAPSISGARHPLAPAPTGAALLALRRAHTACGRHPACRRTRLDPHARRLVHLQYRRAGHARGHGVRLVARADPRWRDRQPLPGGTGAGRPRAGHHAGPLRQRAGDLRLALRPGRRRPTRCCCRRRWACWSRRSRHHPVRLATRCWAGRRGRTPRSGRRWWCSTWSSRSSRCWATGCAKPEWSRRRWPTSSSGSGSRPTTSCGTSGPA